MIYTIGETVIDLIFKNMQPQAAKVGGSALNTSVSLGRLGNDVSFISEIGDDELAELCRSFLKENNVDTSHLISYNDKNTSLALAFLNEQNDAKYRFYKEFSQEMPLQTIDFQATDYLLFSSSFALNERVRSCVVDLVSSAKEAGTMIYYDPNMRKAVDVKSLTYTYFLENLRFASIVHLSNEDAFAVFKTMNVDEIFDILSQNGISVLVYTQNKDAVIVRSRKFKKSFEVPIIQPVSTIGAGDTFNAGILHCLQQYSPTLDSLQCENSSFWDETIPFAISCAANVCMSMDNYVDKGFCEKNL